MVYFVYCDSKAPGMKTGVAGDLSFWIEFAVYCPGLQSWD